MNDLEDNLGTVHEIACSGDHWGDGLVGSLSDLFYQTLRPNKVQDRVQICTYTLGRRNDEIEEFFAILRDLIDNERNVVLIINDEDSGTFPILQFLCKRKLKELRDLAKANLSITFSIPNPTEEKYCTQNWLLSIEKLH